MNICIEFGERSYQLRIWQPDGGTRAGILELGMSRSQILAGSRAGSAQELLEPHQSSPWLWRFHVFSFRMSSLNLLWFFWAIFLSTDFLRTLSGFAQWAPNQSPFTNPTFILFIWQHFPLLLNLLWIWKALIQTRNQHSWVVSQLFCTESGHNFNFTAHL